MWLGGGKTHPRKWILWKRVILNETTANRLSQKRFCDQKMQTKASFSTLNARNREKSSNGNSNQSKKQLSLVKNVHTNAHTKYNKLNVLFAAYSKNAAKQNATKPLCNVYMICNKFCVFFFICFVSFRLHWCTSVAFAKKESLRISMLFMRLFLLLLIFLLALSSIRLFVYFYWTVQLYFTRSLLFICGWIFFSFRLSSFVEIPNLLKINKHKAKRSKRKP